MAVAQSHLNAWRRVADDGVTTLVVEDDAQFLHDFDCRIARICAELHDSRASGPTFDLLYLSYRAVESGMHKTTYLESLFRPIRGLWWLSGYVLTPRGAKKLLDALPIKGPVDQWMNHQFGRLDVYASSTPLIVQRRQLKSDNAYSITPVLQSLRAATSAGGSPELAKSTQAGLNSTLTARGPSARRRSPCVRYRSEQDRYDKSA